MALVKYSKIVAFNLLRILTIAVGCYSLAFIFIDSLGSPHFHEKMAKEPLFWGMHLFGGGVALLISTFTISEFFRLKFIALHKFLGKIYVLAVMVGSVGGLSWLLILIVILFLEWA